MRRRASWLRCSRLRSLDYPSRGSPDHGQQNSRYRRNEARRVGLRDSARAKFVLFQYCISIVILTFRRPSDIYFLRQGENCVVKGLPFTLLSLVGGASRGGRFARFSPSTTIRAAEKTLRNPWSIHCARKPRSRSLPPRFSPRAECAQFRAAPTSSKLLVKYHRWRAKHGTQKTKKHKAQRQVAGGNSGSTRALFYGQGRRGTR